MKSRIRVNLDLCNTYLNCCNIFLEGRVAANVVIAVVFDSAVMPRFRASEFVWFSSVEISAASVALPPVAPWLTVHAADRRDHP